MKPIFVGICAILGPLLYDHYKRKDKIRRKTVLENIKRKYQILDDKTDINQISDDYPVIVYKKIKCGEILDYDLGLKFSDSLALKRKIEIVDQDTLSEISVQPTKYRTIFDKDLKELTNGKFLNTEFNFIAKHAHLDKIKLKDYFFSRFQNEICQVVNSSTRSISNPKSKSGEIILQNENDPHNKFLTNKFIDCYTAGNNVFIQANRNKLLRNDLKINYLAYKPTNFLLICCKEKSIKLLEKNNSAHSNIKNSSVENSNINETKIYELELKPASRYFADDYIVIPYNIQDEAKAKEEIDKVLIDEITQLDYKPLEKKIRKVFYLGGAILIGYGYIVYKLKHTIVWKIKDIAVELFKLIKALF